MDASRSATSIESGFFQLVLSDAFIMLAAYWLFQSVECEYVVSEEAELPNPCSVSPC